MVEFPFVVSGWGDMELEENVVLCIEPRVEIPGVGRMCIERELAITQGGPEILTHCPTQFW